MLKSKYYYRLYIYGIITKVDFTQSTGKIDNKMAYKLYRLRAVSLYI